MVECRADVLSPRIVALSDNNALQWCRKHGVTRAVMAEHFPLTVQFQPNNELFDLLVCKWGAPRS